MGLLGSLKEYKRNRDKINKEKAEIFYEKGMEFIESDLYKEALKEFYKAERISPSKQNQHMIMQCNDALEHIKTKHFEKKDFSFDYPEYYNIANYEISNSIYKNGMALAKKGTLCEIYIMEYAHLGFYGSAFNLKDYLKNRGYENIKIIHGLPNTYTATIKYKNQNIKTVISYNFRFDFAIEITGNVLFDSKYDCSGDIMIIYDSFKKNIDPKTYKWTKCPKCHNRVNKNAINCGFCGKKL